MNNALWSPRGAQARERTHAAGYTPIYEINIQKEWHWPPNTSNYLPPVSLIPCQQHQWYRWQNLSPVASVVVSVANLPPVSLIPVVHLDLRVSPRIFEKI